MLLLVVASSALCLVAFGEGFVEVFFLASKMAESRFPAELWKFILIEEEKLIHAEEQVRWMVG